MFRPGDLCVVVSHGKQTLWKEFWVDTNAGALSTRGHVDSLIGGTVCLVISDHADDVAKQHEIKHATSLLFVVAGKSYGYIWDLYLERVA